MRNPNPNLHFWEYIRNDWVKITLKPDQQLTHTYGGPTDEGWSSYSTTWAHDGDGVSREWCSDGRDCDGRLRTTGRDFCPADKLASVEAYVDDSQLPAGEWNLHRFKGYRICRPDWQKVKPTRVYDEYAQRMNY